MLLLVSGEITLPAGARVVAWGDNQYGQTNVPPDLTNAVALAAGSTDSLALLSDGTVAAWGDNSLGQTNVPVGLSNVVGIACGGDHNVALRADGTLVCWGDNQSGQCQVPGGLSNVVAIAAGGAHSVALRADGTVLAWGDNYYGQTNVPQGLANVVAISAGAFHTLALRADGTVTGWGMYFSDEYFYQIMGDDWWYPSQPVGLTNVVAIASAANDGLVLRDNGTMFLWGDGFSGQFTTPTGLSNMLAIAAGGYHLLGLQADGTIIAWGLDSSGQANVPPGLSNVVAIAGGGFHSLALVGNGRPLLQPFLPHRLVAAGVEDVRFYAPAVGSWPLVYQWEFNGTPLTGETNAWLTLMDVSPAQAGLYSMVVSNAYGIATSPGVRLTVAPADITQPPQDQIKYLGGTATFSVQAQSAGPLSYQWQLNGANLAGETNAMLVVSNASWQQQGNRYSVALSNVFGTIVSQQAQLKVVNVAAWGDNYDTSQIYKGQATPPADFTNIVAVAGGGYHSLALRSDGTVVAWGDDHFGQTDVPAGLSNVVALAAGYAHSLALCSDGSVAAWGLDDHGQTDVPAGLTNVVAIACGTVHSLALRADGSVLAWGDQTNFAPALADVTAIAAGGGQSMALQTDGKIAAWGYTQYGASKIPEGLSNIVSIACGYAHSMAERADHTVIAWGNNSAGQTNVPAGLTNVLAIASGGLASHNLALVADGTVLAWGMNDFGQTNVPADLGNVRAIACGGGHSLAIIENRSSKLSPLVAAPFFTNGLFSASVQTQYGRVYAMEYKNFLKDAAWTLLPLVRGNGSVQTIIDPEQHPNTRFYRVRQW